MTINNIN